MAYSAKVRRQARDLFIQHRSTIPAISVTLDVPEGTLTRWKAEAKKSGDDWDLARSAAVMANDGFDSVVSSAVESFTIMFQTTMEQIQEAHDLEPAAKVKLMASLSDAFNKMISAAGRASPSLSKLAIASEVLTKLADYIHDEFDEHAEAFVEILEPFGLVIAKAYSE